MLIKRLLTAVILVPLVVIATLKLDNSEFAIAMMPILVIGSWEFSSLIKMRRWLAKGFIRFSSDDYYLLFKPNTLLVNASFSYHIALVDYQFILDYQLP